MERLRFNEVGRVLQGLVLDTVVSQAIVRRTLLAHKLAKRDALMAARRRVAEGIVEPQGVDLVGKLADLEDWRKRKQKEIDAICGRLSAFRAELVAVLKKAAG